VHCSCLHILLKIILLKSANYNLTDIVELFWPNYGEKSSNTVGIYDVKLGEPYRPVVVEVAEFVGKTLHVVWLESSRVMDDVVVSWCHGSLAH